LTSVVFSGYAIERGTERIDPWWKMVPHPRAAASTVAPSRRSALTKSTSGTARQVLEGAVGQVVQADHLVPFRCKTTA
jgi:hypothetical protein